MAVREYEKKMIADIKHEDQTNAASRGHLLLQWQEWRMAADGKGGARKDCHSLCTEHEPGALLFTCLIGRSVIHSVHVYKKTLCVLFLWI